MDASDIPRDSWEKVKKFLEPKPPLYCPNEPYVKQKAFLRAEQLEVLYGGSAGGGKDLNTTVTILTTDGWTTIGELKVGQFVYDENGDPTEVLAKSEVFNHECYEVTMADGEQLVVGGGHLWNVSTERERASHSNALPENQAKRRAKRASRSQTPEQLQAKAEAKGDGSGLSVGNSESAIESNSRRAAEARENKPYPNIWDYTTTTKTSDLADKLRSERKRLTIPTAAPIQGTGDWKSEIPPYTLGAWLGDGNSAGTYVCASEDDYPAMRTELEADGWVVQDRIQEGKGQPIHLMGLRKPDGRSLRSILKNEGFLENKHIPAWVVNAPFADRQAFLGGICDTDGHVDERGRIQFCMAREQMVRDTHSLFWSIGCRPTAVKHKVTKNQDPNFRGNAWRFDVSQCSEYIFRMPRKRDKLRTAIATKTVNSVSYRYIQSVQRVDSVPTQCIQVANPRGLFRVGRTFITTHNSDSLIMGALQNVDVPGYSAMIFRNSYSDLALPGAIMDRAKEWWREYPEVRFSNQSSTATFPSGATISFGYLQNATDYLRYKGMEVQYLGFDELTEIRERSYTYLLSRLRKPSIESGLALARVPLRARSASNPAPNWVRRYFIEEGEANGRLYIPAGFRDNPFLDQESYAEALSRLSPVDRAQLENGDWYAAEAGVFFNGDDFHDNVISPNDISERVRTENVVRYWDLAATEPSERNPDPDWTVGAKVSMVDGVMFILDIVRFRGNSAEVERKVRQTAHNDGVGVRVRMEKDPGQAGKAQISHYGRHVLLGYNFDGNPVTKDKESRVNLWAPKVKRGEVKLVSGGDWITDFVGEAVGFGSTTNLHDDQMDAVSGAFEILTGISTRKRGTVKLIV